MNTTQNHAAKSGAKERLRRPPRPVLDELTAQGAVDPAMEAKLKAERVQEMLRAMPDWQLTLGGKGIHRVRELPSAEVAMLYSTFVTGFAKAYGLPVGLHISGGQVRLTVHARRCRGRLGDLTEHVVGFAQQLG